MRLELVAQLNYSMYPMVYPIQNASPLVHSRARHLLYAMRRLMRAIPHATYLSYVPVMLHDAPYARQSCRALYKPYGYEEPYAATLYSPRSSAFQ